MEWVFGMEYKMKILSYTFGVRVTNVISWDSPSHDNTGTYFFIVNTSAY